MDELVLLLLKKGAHLKPVRITTSEIGRMLGMSQQNASRRLLELRNAGIAERGRNGIMLSKKGLDEAGELYAELKAVFERSGTAVSGTIVSGLGEGKYYLSFAEYKKQLKSLFMFEPYEGTLNVKLSPAEAAKKAHFLKSTEPALVKGFVKKGRTFGDLFAYPCMVEGEKCALIVPLRTHHPSEVIEIVAARNLKKALGKKDGDEVKIEFG